MICTLPRASFVLALLLSACAGHPPDVGVAQKWNDAITRYNLVPIYPMREDVQIGDVFLYLPPQNGANGSQPATWLNRLGSPGFSDVLQALDEEYCHRFRMAPAIVTTPPAATTTGTTSTTTPAAAAAVGATIETTTTVQGVSTTQKVSVPAATKPAPTPPKPVVQKPPAAPLLPAYVTRCPPKPTAITAAASPSGGAAAPPFPFDVQQAGAKADLRVHRVELPEIAVATVTDAELAAAIPVSGFLGKIGLGTSSNVGLDISLSGIEEIHLPFNIEFELFEKEKESFVANIFPPGMFLAYLYQKRPDLLPAACFVDSIALNASHLQILVANQVVYAHGINYAYKSSSTVAGQLGAALAASAATAAKPSTPSGTSSGATNVTTNVTTNAGTGTNGATADKPGASSSPPVSPVSDAQAALTAESAKIAGLTGSLSGPGGTLQAGIGRSGNLTLSDKFEEPLAFGIGDLLEYSPSDLLQLYRLTALAPTVAADGKAVIDSANKYYGIFCNDNNKPPGKLSLLDYITKSQANVTGMAPPAAPLRFRPFEGLPIK